VTENPTAATTLDKDNLIVIAGAGGFIGGALARYFYGQGFANIRAVDKKPGYKW
jgi:nucleoside-diphosphate-sugar epimerase